jgi:hypothetical protein
MSIDTYVNAVAAFMSLTASLMPFASPLFKNA